MKIPFLFTMLLSSKLVTRNVLGLAILVYIWGCQPKSNPLFPEIGLAEGITLVAPFHGCSSCFNKIITYAADNPEKSEVIIIAVNNSEYKALSNLYATLQNIHIVREYNKEKLYINRAHYIEVKQGNIINISVIPNEDIVQILAGI